MITYLRKQFLLLLRLIFGKYGPRIIIEKGVRLIIPLDFYSDFLWQQKLNPEDIGG